MFSNRRFLRVCLLVIALVSVYALALGVRRDVLKTQEASLGPDLPFTLESALHYRRIKIMHDRGALPEIDPAIQYPEGIRVAAIDGVSSEPLYARLASLFPESVPFAARIRWIEAGWFCLSVPLLAVMLRVWTGSWMAGLWAAALFAVMISSVLRSTGQEISRENFAMPWLIASYAAAAAAFRREGTGRIIWTIVSGILLSAALSAWDMVQYVVGLWTLGASLHLLRRGRSYDRGVLLLASVYAVAVLSTGLFNPYHHHHGLPWSPLMAWMLSVPACAYYLGRPEGADAGSASRLRTFMPLLILFGPMLVFLLIGKAGAYGASYSHFGELLAAKIRFLNVKPDDPAQLTFYQRIMWVPSLHSANWGLTKWLFPFTLWVSGCMALVALFAAIRRPDPLIHHWLLLFVVSIVAYVLFVRFHLFVGLGAAVLAGWGYGAARRAGWGWGLGTGALLFLAVVVEAGHTWEQRVNMGRPNVYYEELNELSAWLREHVAPGPVLANMGASAYIAAYGKCAVVLHPKFEDPAVRERMRHYGELLFGEDELALRDWMDDLGVEYLVYAKGEFSREQPGYQMRYFVNRMDPPDHVPARRFERDDDTLRFFHRKWSNHKYVVYETLSRADEREAARFAGEAMEQLQSGRLFEAEQAALSALAIDAGQEEALKVMRHVGSLLEQGVRAAEPGGAP